MQDESWFLADPCRQHRPRAEQGKATRAEHSPQHHQHGAQCVLAVCSSSPRWVNQGEEMGGLIPIFPFPLAELLHSALPQLVVLK